ncbi:MAG: tetratricopeptide repeat protein [Lacinutrix sp.]|uniref:tetratricopeptide repeat protein n=1 Tax=Lacinutrix sp. TaxID=1937692 RepID=UPI0030A81ADE
MESPNLQRGIQLFELGRYKESIPYFQNALTENSESFTAKYLLAQCYFQLDDIDKSLTVATDLRKEYPNLSDVYFLLSQIYLNKGNKKEANENIEKAIEINPHDENYFGQKAYILINNKEFNSALEFSNEGLRINSKSIFCLNVRTTALTKLNRKEEAASSIENLLNDNPENAYSHANVGWSHLESNKPKEALKHFKEALVLDPNLDYARSGMVTAMKSKNKVYNLYLRYAYWMSNKSQKNQYIFIIGLYITYRFALNMLSSSGLTVIAIPLIVAYLLFALGSWIMDPLSNMILMFDKFGKYLLDKEDKLSGQIMFGLLASSLLFFAIYFVLNKVLFALIIVACLAAILPLTRAALSNDKKSKIINYSYGTLILLVAAFGTSFGFPFDTVATAVGYYLLPILG